MTKRAYDYAGAAGPFRLLRDGKEILTGTERECWTYLHRHHSYSVAWALTYEGYRMVPVTAVEE